MDYFIQDVHRPVTDTKVDIYDPHDYPTLRERIKKGVLNAITRRFPLENDRYRLEAFDFKYDRDKPFSKKEQKLALLEGRSLEYKLTGRWRLVDKTTNKPVSVTGRKTLINVPYLTERGTYIRNGVEVSLPIQMRLASGVFARKKDNGELEAHVNVKQGTGQQFTINMDPSSGVFYFHVGTKNLKLYPILRTMGIADSELEKRWGREILKNNQQASLGAVPIKSLRGFIKTAADFELDEDERKKLISYFQKMELDPDSTKYTLGKPYSRVEPNLILDISTKLLDLTRGKTVYDNRDSLEHQRFYTAPDLLAERILKDSGRVGSTLLWKATNKGNLDFIPAGVLNDYLDAVYDKARLAQVLEEVNPLEIYQRNNKITRMGEGGISGVRTAPMSARLIQNTYRGFIDPVQSVESLRVGLDNQAADGIRIGDNGLMYVKMYSPRARKEVWVDSLTSATKNVALEGSYDPTDKYIPVLSGDSIKYVKRHEVDYIIPHGDRLFAALTNMVPLKSGVVGNRLYMGSKFGSQALALVNRESPLVRSLDPVDGVSAEEKMARYLGAVRAPRAGKVIRVGRDSMKVQYDDGTVEEIDFYNNFPFNRKTYIRSIPKVKTGQTFKKGTVLLGSNYTDDQGDAALGTTLKVAYLAHHGENYKDAVVMSESAAKKMTSEHMYSSLLRHDRGLVQDREKYKTLYPGQFDKAVYDTLDENGVVKPGTVLRKGSPMIVAYRENPPTFGTMGRRTFTDKTITWHHDFPAIVTDIAHGKKGTTVFVRANVPAQEGDKVANRYGGKGVIAKILPDDQMPLDENGEPIDLLLGPTGVVSRTNAAQLAEAALGKAALKRGKPYILPGFMKEDISEFAENELKKYGLKAKETIFDPIANKKIPNVSVGHSYIYKLQHTAESKKSARATGGYTQEDLPSPGGEEGAKRLGNLVVSSLVAHDALEVLRDAKLIRGQRNDDFWRDFKMGRTPTMPNTPLVYHKFLESLKAAGINVHKDRDKVSIYAMTDKDARQLTGGREVKTADTYDSRSFKPIPSGLFGTDVFGSDGNVWGYIKLDEPVLNPVMEEPIRRILGVRQKDVEQILSGQKPLPNGETGGKGLYNYLSKLNLDAEMLRALNDIKSGAKSKKDDAIKRYRALYAMKKHKVIPADFMLTRIPVIPPRYRPISSMDDTTLISDANYLYKDLLEARDDLREAMGQLPDDMLAKERIRLYRSFKALTGLADPDSRKLQNKKIGGFFKWIMGDSPKMGAFQRNVVGSTMDIAGRAAITPNSSLKMDEVGLPEEQAWVVYSPFVIRDMVKRGHRATDAVNAVANKTPDARTSLERVMSERPLIITRAPALHKFSVIAVKPKLVKGHTLQISPAVTMPFNADFDGDCMSYYVPVSDKAVKEAYEKMLPSKNILSARFFKAHYYPEEEYVLGLYLATRSKGGYPKHIYKTRKDAIRAFRLGEIKADDKIKILEDGK